MCSTKTLEIQLKYETVMLSIGLSFRAFKFYITYKVFTNEFYLFDDPKPFFALPRHPMLS